MCHILEKKLKIIEIDFGTDNFIRYKRLNTFSDRQKTTSKITAIFKEYKYNS